MAKNKEIASEDENNQTLPELLDGELAVIQSITLLEKKTRPPNQYTEGSLIADMKGAAKFLENDPALKKLLKDVSGLGTSATRDSIIETLKYHKYIEKSGKYLIATEKGIEFIQWLDKVLPEIADVSVTARWEAELAIVAKEGGGISFENRVAQKIRDMIAIFKVAPPMSLISTTTSPTKDSSTMSDNSTGNNSTPSDKMLDFAKAIATKTGQRVPDAVMVDWEACKKFIDENKDAAMRPSDKQVNFATKIAGEKKLTIPPDILKNGRDLSKWIDENK